MKEKKCDTEVFHTKKSTSRHFKFRPNVKLFLCGCVLQKNRVKILRKIEIKCVLVFKYEMECDLQVFSHNFIFFFLLGQKRHMPAQ